MTNKKENEEFAKFLEENNIIKEKSLLEKIRNLDDDSECISGLEAYEILEKIWNS